MNTVDRLCRELCVYDKAMAIKRRVGSKKENTDEKCDDDCMISRSAYNE